MRYSVQKAFVIEELKKAFKPAGALLTFQQQGNFNTPCLGLLNASQHRTYYGDAARKASFGRRSIRQAEYGKSLREDSTALRHSRSFAVAQHDAENQRAWDVRKPTMVELMLDDGRKDE